LAKALANGKHVCCEKPLSADKNIAWKMYELSLKYPHLKVGCAFPRRFSKVYKEARKAIASGAIGDVIAVRSSAGDLYNPDREEFFKFLRTSGGIFLDMNVHDIDISLFLAGKDRNPGTAFAVGTREVYPEFAEWNDADNVHGIVTMEDDLVINIYGSRGNRDGHHTSTEVIGTKGRIMINGEPRRLNLNISTERGTTMAPAAQHWDLFEDGFVGEVEAFRDWVLFDKQDHGFNLKDAAKTVSIAHGLNESFLKKTSVPVKLID
jgi:predicted dehydrogenase